MEACILQLFQGVEENKTSFYLAIKYFVNNKFVKLLKKCYDSLINVFFIVFRCPFLQIEFEYVFLR